MTINGFALLIWFVALVIVGVTCYCWGRSDERDRHRNKRCLASVRSFHR